MGVEPVVLLGRLMDSRLGYQARIGVYDSVPANPRPTFELKESVAWKILGKQELVDTLRWISTSTIQ